MLGVTWQQVDFRAGTVRLEPGTTKNGEGRTFPFAPGSRLAELLGEQWERTQAFQRERGRIVERVFHRAGEAVGSFRKAWRRRAGDAVPRPAAHGGAEPGARSAPRP